MMAEGDEKTEEGPLIAESFSFKLGYEVKVGCVTIGNLNGTHPHLACAIPGGRVVVHNPFHARTEERMDANLLHFNEEITALSCGNLEPTSSPSAVDLIFVGSAHHLVAYNIVDNKNHFSTELSDGCSCLSTGTLSDSNKPLIYIGGTCSIYGYDAQGTDEFWTVTGDDVISMVVSEFKDSSKTELVVGSNNCEVHAFNSEGESTDEMALSAVVSRMKRIGSATIAFGLSTGVVGVLKEGKQIWESKTKHQVTSLEKFEVNGRVAVVVGWSNGLLEFRNVDDGTIIFSESLKTQIAGLAVSDYRKEGKDHLLVVLTSGRVVAFSSGTSAKHSLGAAPVVKENYGAKIRLLQQKRKDLLYRLGNLKKLQKKKSKASSDFDTFVHTKTNSRLEIIDGKLHLLVDTTSGIKIQSVTLLNDGLYEEDAHTEFFVVPVRVAKILLPTPKLAEFHLTIRSLIGDGLSSKFLVTQGKIVVKKYSCFSREDVSEPSLLNAYAANPSIEEKILHWIKSSFSGCEEIASLSPPVGLVSSSFGSIFFAVHGETLVIGSDIGHTLNSIVNDLRDRVVLNPITLQKTVTVFKHVSGKDDEVTSSESTLLPSIKGETIQNPNLNHARIEVNEKDKGIDDGMSVGNIVGDDVDGGVVLVLQSVQDLHSVRQKLVAEIAENSTLAKSLLLRAEDHRIMGNFVAMQQAYGDVMDVNKDILRAHAFRYSNQEKLMSQVRILNKIIHERAERNGGGAFIDSCRQAIKENDYGTLLDLLQN
eukprot:m.6870 g.6870  ORF g.6870 m.6870 type:complete len:761 (-) comp2668_c0_seq1:36-2318(-)